MNRVLIIMVVCGFASIANAHEVRPAYLEIREATPDTYDILWKVPARGDERLAIYVRLPDDATQLTQPAGMAIGGAYIERWRIMREGGLAGQAIGIDGLNATAGVDVLVRIEHADGSTQVERLLPRDPSFIVEASPSALHVAGAYLLLGIEHILGGIDHLLFILVLLILVKGTRRLVATVTAFTVAHSLTLAAAVLGFVHVPGPPVEASIALSIVFVASEIVHTHQGRPGLTARWPWLVAFAFGLLHGLGFAGALSEVGLPQSAIPVALLFFNLGVEAGQLLFIAVVLIVIALARRLNRDISIPMPKWSWRVAPYGIGSVAAFWMIQRIAVF